MKKVAIALAATLVYAASACAQSAFPTEYPAEAKPVAGSEISSRFTGKVFTVKSMTSGSWRLEFDTRGYAFVDTDSGYRDSGPWRVEGERWCAKMARTGDNCADLYAVGETLFYKRVKNGEVVSMTLR